MKEDYVSFETARLLKEKGFDEECRAFWKDWNGEIRLCSCNNAHMFEYCHNSMLERYNDAEETNIAAPTLQMAMKWLREVHKIYVNVCPSVEGYYWTEKWHSYVENLEKRYPFGMFIGTFNSYEEACEAAIKYCL